MRDVWERLSSVERGFDDVQLRLARPDMSSGPEFTCQLLRAIAETASWAAALGCDLDDADDRARMVACLASVEGCLAVLRTGLVEAMAREAK